MLARAEEHGLPLPENWRDRYEQDPSAPSTGTFRGYGRWFVTRRARPRMLDPSEKLHGSITQRTEKQTGNGTWNLFGRTT